MSFYFAGLQVARHLLEYGKDNAEITVVDRKSYLLYVPNWVPHDFMKGLPISDEVGFVITDRSMRNPGYPEVFAAGDAAGATVPKLATLGHKQSFIVARQLAVELGTLEKEKVGHLYDPAVVCYGDMGDNKAFYIHSNIWYGGSKSTLKMGHLYYMIKVALKNMYFSRGGKIKSWELDFGEILSDHL